MKLQSVEIFFVPWYKVCIVFPFMILSLKFKFCLWITQVMKLGLHPGKKWLFCYNKKVRYNSDTYLAVQWAAVRTYLLFISEPPQNMETAKVDMDDEPVETIPA